MERKAEVERATSETRVRAALNLDGTGSYAISTPLPFLSHMVEQLSRHSLIDTQVDVAGDVEIDGHHTTEDLAIVLGQTLAKALGDKAGISRYGSATLPMDEACVTCALDLSGRTSFRFGLQLAKAKLGTFDSELAEVFFEGFARGASCNLHLIQHAGTNLHHLIEVSFKALGRALKAAVQVDSRVRDIPSTKGAL